MSQRDLVAELRAARASRRPPSCASASALIAAADAARAQPLHLAPRARRRAARRRGGRRRARRHAARRPPDRGPATRRPIATRAPRSRCAGRADRRHVGTVGAARTPARAQSTSATRVQQYGAYLALRVPTPDGVSDGVKRALRIASSLGGYPTSVHANSHGQAPRSADLTLKIPRAHVQDGDHAALRARHDHGRAGRRPGPPGRPRTRPTARSRGCRRSCATLRAPSRRPTRQRADRRADRADRAPAARRGGHDPRRPLRDGRSCTCTTPREGSAGAPRSRPAARPRRRVPLDRDRRGLRARARRCRCSLLLGLGWLAVRARAPPARGRARSVRALSWANTRKVGSPTGSSSNSGLTQPRSSRRAPRRCCSISALHIGSGRAARRIAPKPGLRASAARSMSRSISTS